MTTTAKPVRRETFSSVRERGQSRPLMIELHSTWMRLRLKGKRNFYTVTYDQLWTLGAKNAVEDRHRLKIEARKKGRVDVG